MTERPSEQPENKEIMLPFSPLWLAGIFEVGGSMHFTISHSTIRGVQYPHAYPVMKIGERNLERITRFKDLVGGNFQKGGVHASPTYWYMQGTKVVALAEVMRPYAPSRQEIIQAYQDWEIAESMEDRIEIAHASREKHTLNLSPGHYTTLVANPDFLAGVVDMRGCLYTNEAFDNDTTDSHSWMFPRLSINSTNRPLIEALNHQYGGSVEEVILKGTKQNRLGTEFIAENDSLRWRTGHEGYDAIMQRVGPNLKLLTQY